MVEVGFFKDFGGILGDYNMINHVMILHDLADFLSPPLSPRSGSSFHRKRAGGRRGRLGLCESHGATSRLSAAGLPFEAFVLSL